MLRLMPGAKVLLVSDEKQIDGLSIVIPVFRNRAALSVLAERIDSVLSPQDIRYEIIFVDDASDDASWPKIQELAKTSPYVRGLRLARNRGQHLSVLLGLSCANAGICVVLDADLQDPPEAIPMLLASLRESGADLVFAGRSGKYQAWGRMLSSWLYRRLLLNALVGLPSGAGMYFAATRSGVQRMMELNLVGEPMVIGMIAAARLHCKCIPVQRSIRAHGRSAYTSLRRLRSALNMMHCALFTNRRDGQRINCLISTLEIADSVASGGPV